MSALFVDQLATGVVEGEDSDNLRTKIVVKERSLHVISVKWLSPVSLSAIAWLWACFRCHVKARTRLMLLVIGVVMWHLHLHLPVGLRGTVGWSRFPVALP